MTDEQIPAGVVEQEEIVQRYALQLRQTACGTRRPAEPGLQRCYEMINQCAMELADAARRTRPGGVSGK